MTGANTIPAGKRATWQSTAPSGLSIEGASIAGDQMYSIHVDDGQGWGGGFYWSGGRAGTSDSMTHYGVAGLHSPYFGFQIVCGWSTCDGREHPAQLTVETISLFATETQGPTLSAPDGLWQARGWVRGQWQLHFFGDSPSGLCSLSAAFNGRVIPGSSSTVNSAAWHQCSAPPVSQTIQSGDYGEGALPLTIEGRDAAGVPVSDSRPVYVDNSQPTISLSGPTDAASTGGTQDVTASASSSPSGIAGLSCNVDGGPNQWIPQATAQIPVSGVGQHTVQCSAANNAIDGSGNHGWSHPAEWSLKIGEPTISAIGFTNVVDALRCQRVREPTTRVEWVTVQEHGRRVRVRKLVRGASVKLTRCHARIESHRITVWRTVVRHDRKVHVRRTEVVRIVVLPHIVAHATRRIQHGSATTVNGWLGTADGTAIAGQRVVVLAAPDNGGDDFRVVAVVVTRSDGGWSARLKAGPSRLVEAVYFGGATAEAGVSGRVRLVVPAKIELISAWPPAVPWGGTVRITGQLAGGYLPLGGALVRLRIGLGSSFTTWGIQEHVGGRGIFQTPYIFGVAPVGVYRTYWFQICSLPIGDYPYAPACSRRVNVTVGGDPGRGVLAETS